MPAPKGNRAKAQVLSKCDMSTLLESEDANVEGLWTASKGAITRGSSSDGSIQMTMRLRRSGFRS